jgi:hypothetical protein
MRAVGIGRSERRAARTLRDPVVIDALEKRILVLKERTKPAVVVLIGMR